MQVVKLHQTLSELSELSNKIDCYQFMQSPHFTTNPIPDLIHYSVYPPDNKLSLKHQSTERVNKIIKVFKEQSKNLKAAVQF